MPVAEMASGGGMPVSEAAAGWGVPVTKVAAGKLGLPVTFETIGIVAPVAYATFDGTPALGSVVSNGGLTVAHGSTSSNAGVISTAAKTSGKFYFEVTSQVATSSSNVVGIASGTIANMGTTIIYSNDVSTTKNLGATAVGDVFGFAIDLTGRLAWVRRNGGLWNADAAANPATGVGGVIIEAGSFAPGVRFSNAGGTTVQFTGNFGQSAFVGAVPSGFTAGWPA